ncbi:uncharacterized protein LOC127639195 [Xyrauchen texanus]|uniref:uncharacterized protein LOC127639195 n=1 Tax=Xyrauchen texanus TaxID=154827 RepID=UPI002241B22A|nr:uncharacterized protein LOC127639195 [Xyrauchen texanus]XP_051977058.1 uncharacterized protein LOC127639195 [Xyrauchen texanus]
MDMPVILLLTLLSGECVTGFTGNVALGLNAVQSSTFEHFTTAEKATDGNKESDYKNLSCSHTGIERNPWWRVDLKHVYNVTNVTITNRGDCCVERIDGAEIRVGNSLNNNGNNNQLVEVISSIPLGATKTFTFMPTSGQYVNIHLPGDAKILTLCEVEVFAETEGAVSTRNVALGLNAVQSSTLESFATAEKATDGNKESDYKKLSCSHTGVERNPWWRVDLMHVFKVTRVNITNRDCCVGQIDGAEIRVGNSLNNNGNNNQLAAVILSMPTGATKTFVFTPISGRYVNIYLPGDFKGLTLCEVEVFAAETEVFTSEIKEGTLRTWCV